MNFVNLFLDFGCWISCNCNYGQATGGWYLNELFSSPENFNKNIDSLFKLISIIGAIIVIYKTYKEVGKWRNERKEANTNRAEDLNWRKVKEAKALYDELLSKNSLSWQALQMIDFIIQPNSSYVLEDLRSSKKNVKYKVDLKSIRIALSFDKNGRYSVTPKSKKEKKKYAYILRCFDNLFYKIGLFKFHIDRKLVNFDDVVHPLDYYIRIILGRNLNAENDKKSQAKHLYILQYAKRYGFKRSLLFINEIEDFILKEDGVDIQINKELTDYLSSFNNLQTTTETQ